MVDNAAPQLDADSDNRYCIRCAYRLTGLSEPRCPECGSAFDPSDARTWSQAPGHLRRHAPLAASFSGAVVGGSLALGLNLLYEGYSSAFGHVTDHASRIFSATVLSFVWWLLLVIPGLFIDRGRILFRSMLTAVSSGAIAAALALWLCFGWELRSATIANSAWHTVTAMIGGAITGGAARAAMKQPWVRSAARRSARAMLLLWLAGPMCVAFWLILAWPAICRASPDLAYRVGSDDTRLWALRFTLQQVKVGDPSAVLYGYLPAFFGAQAPGDDSKTWSLERDGKKVHIRIDGGRVAELRY